VNTVYQYADQYRNTYFVFSTIIYAIHPQLKCGAQYGRNTDTPRNASHPT